MTIPSDISSVSDDDVAIIGMALRVPGATDWRAFWSLMLEGKDAFRAIPPSSFNQDLPEPQFGTFSLQAGYLLDGIEYFDADLFRIPAPEARLMDPQHRHFLECAWEAMEDSGYYFPTLDKKVSVYAACGDNLYPFHLMQRGVSPETQYEMLTGNRRDHVAMRLAYKLNLKGESITLGTTCSGSLVAVHLACASLRSQQSDYAMAGGVAIHLTTGKTVVNHPDSHTSKAGRCRAFDATADGTAFASGTGVLVLKRAKHALNDGDHCYAIIRGSAVNNDGKAKVGYSAPSVRGQVEVIRAARDAARCHDHPLHFIECHGTGTKLGDPIEVEALRRTYGTGSSQSTTCFLGATKNNIGHLDAAAGVVGVIKTALCLYHRIVPPLAGFSSLNPEISFRETPFRIPLSAQPLGSEKETLIGGVSSFGVGGTNAHMILSSAPNEPKSAQESGPFLAVYSARTPSALESLLSKHLSFLRANQDCSLSSYCFTLAFGRAHFEHRASFMVESIPNLIESLVRFLQQPETDLNGYHVALGEHACSLVKYKRRFQDGEVPPFDKIFQTRCSRISLPSLPLTRERYWYDQLSRIPVSSPTTLEHGKGTNYPTPTVRDIWNESLGTEDTTIDKDFFALGGDSVTAIQILSRIHEHTGVSISLAEFLSCPTLQYLESRANDKQTNVNVAAFSRFTALSFQQRRLWEASLGQPSSSAYNVGVRLSLTGTLHEEMFDIALREVFQKNNLLGAHFTQNGEDVTQEFGYTSSPPMEYVDLSACTPLQREELKAALTFAKMQTPFDLTGGSPLVRCIKIRLSAIHYEVILITHHIVSDGWSLRLLVQDLSATYSRLVHGTLESPVKRGTPYSALIHQQSAYAEHIEHSEGHAFWKCRLNELPAGPTLPMGRISRRPSECSSTRISFSIAQETYNRLQHHSQRLGIPLFATLLSGFALTISRHTKQDALTLSVPFSGRISPEVASMVGPCVTLLPVGLIIEADKPIDRVLINTHEELLRISSHQHHPLTDLLLAHEDLDRVRSWGNVCFALHNLPPVDWQDSTTSLAIEEIPSNIPKYLLSCECHQRDDTLSGFIEYAQEVFDDAWVSSLQDDFMHVLQSIASAQLQCDLLAPQVNSKMPTIRRKADAQINSTWLSMILDSSKTFEDRIAVRCGSRSLNYKEMWGLAERIAEEVKGAHPGGIAGVAILLPRNEYIPPALLGVAIAGCFFVLIDESVPRYKQTQMLACPHCSIVLTSRAIEPPGLIEGEVLYIEDMLDSLPREQRVSKAEITDLAYVMFTSGSTGIPKAVAISNLALTNYLHFSANTYFDRAPGVVPLCSSLSFDLSLTALLTPLLAGKTIDLIAGAEPFQLLIEKLIHGARYDLLKLTPSHLRILTAIFRSLGRYPQIDTYVIGGESLKYPDIEYLFTSPEPPRVINEYGPTETVVGCSTFEVNNLESGEVPIGDPLPGCSLYVLDTEHRPITSVGVAGELYIGGVCVGDGYLNDPTLTEHRFIPDPFCADQEAKMYASGDLVELCKNGELIYLGRADNQVKLNGVRIELSEIEGMLCRELGASLAVCCIQQTPESDVPGLCCVVQRSLNGTGKDFQAMERRDHVRVHEGLVRTLGPLSFPVYCFWAARVPLTANGKVDRLTLQQLIGHAPSTAEKQTARNKPLLSPISDIVVKVFGAMPDTNRSFFELGGDSLTAYRFVFLLKNAGITTSVTSLYRAKSLNEFLAECHSSSPVSAGATSSYSAPLTFAQQWFFGLSLLDPSQWNVAISLAFKTPVPHELLEKALSLVCQQHDALSARFSTHEGIWEQVIDPQKTSRFEVVPSSNPLSLVQERDLHFDLSTGPLLKLIIKRTEPLLVTDAVLVGHHLILDTLSCTLLLSGLDTAISALIRGAQVPEIPRRPLCQSTRSSVAVRCAVGNHLRLDHSGERTSLESDTVIYSSVFTSSDIPNDSELVESELLAAVVSALAPFSEGNLVICRESMGRQGIPFESQESVSWHTQFTPLTFQREHISQPSKLQRLAIEILRRSTPCLEAREFARMCQEEQIVIFNFLGNCTHISRGFDCFQVSPIPNARNRARGNLRPFALEFNFAVIQDSIYVEVSYARNQFQPSTIDRIVFGIRDAVESMHSRPSAGLKIPISQRIALSTLERCRKGHATGAYQLVGEIFNNTTAPSLIASWEDAFRRAASLSEPFNGRLLSFTHCFDTGNLEEIVASERVALGTRPETPDSRLVCVPRDGALDFVLTFKVHSIDLPSIKRLLKTTLGFIDSDRMLLLNPTGHRVEKEPSSFWHKHAAAASAEPLIFHLRPTVMAEETFSQIKATLGTDVLNQLQKSGEISGHTPPLFARTIWAIALYAVRPGRSVTFGVQTSWLTDTNRMAIGPFTNLSLISLDVREDFTINETITGHQERLPEWHANSGITLLELANLWGKDLGRALPSSVFIWETAPLSSLNLLNTNGDMLAITGAYPNVEAPIRLVVEPHTQGIEVTLNYLPGDIPFRTADRLLRYFMLMFHRALRHPTDCIKTHLQEIDLHREPLANYLS